MKKARTKQLVLIGYSGGAQIAGLLAVRHPEQVRHVITIAGVLDHAAWTSYHGDDPLTDSLNLITWQSEFRKLPQTHYAGAKDTIVPPSLIQAVAADDTVVIVPRATHDSGYSSVYHQIYEVQ